MTDRRKRIRHWKISVKQKMDLTTAEKKYLKSLEPFIAIEIRPPEIYVYYWTSWHSRVDGVDRRVLRLDIVENIGNHAYVTDDFHEAFIHCMEFSTKERKISPLHGSCFIPLNELLSNREIPDSDIDYEELKRVFSLEKVGNKLIRVKKD